MVATQSGSEPQPFQEVFYLRFALMYWAYAQMRRFVYSVHSNRLRAFRSEAILAGRVRYTRHGTNDKNPCDLRGLACLAQAQQDPERGARKRPFRLWPDCKREA